MKFWKTIFKNFKILFRRKTSLIAIILGPLLVIFLIGFAFNTSSQFQISVGYVAPDNSTLTGEFVQTLQEQYVVKEFQTKDDCSAQLKQGVTHMCIIFPKDFVIENNKVNNVTFVVDKTRINVVYSILGSVNDKIGLKSDQLSKDLTDTLISTLDSTSSDIDTNLGSLIRLKKSIESSQEKVSTISSSFSSINLNTETVDTTDLSDDVDRVSSLAKSIRDEGVSVSRDGLEVVNILRAQITNTTLLVELDGLEADLESLNSSASEDYDSITEKVTTIQETIDSTIESIDSLNDKLSTADSSVSSGVKSLAVLRQDLGNIISDIDSIKQGLEKSSQGISQIAVTSTDQIVNPIQTNIETVSSDKNQLLILFPYVLLLIVMFVGLMLSSTLVIVEKKSKAYFRIFTTPTRDEFYLWTTFFTSFIIVALQVAVILVLMELFFVKLISANLLVNLILLIVSISIFIMIGMGIGYLLSNQQGTNMASISVGAIFLFISNMVLPLESISPHLKKIAQYNPYVLASEMLRQSTLFNASFNQLGTGLGILVSYTIIIAMFIIIFQGMSKNLFFKNIPHIKSKKKTEKQLFSIKGTAISSEKELIEEVHNLREEEFKLLVKKSKPAKKFIRDILDHKDIAKSLRKLNKKEFLDKIADKNEELIKDVESKSKRLKKKEQ